MTKRKELLSRIYKDYTAPLRTYIDLNFPLIGQDREDTLQEILEKVVRRIHQYDSRYALSTWIYRIARNHCVDIARRHQRSPSSDPVEPELLTSPAADPVEQFEAEENRRRIGLLLSRLPVEERQVMFLRYFEEMTYREIADVMDKPVGTLKYMVHKAKAWMRDNWEVAS